MSNGIDYTNERIQAWEVPKKTSQEPQVSDEVVVFKIWLPTNVCWQCCSHLWSQEHAMVMGLDWTDMASSPEQVELIKP